MIKTHAWEFGRIIRAAVSWFFYNPENWPSPRCSAGCSSCFQEFADNRNETTWRGPQPRHRVHRNWGTRVSQSTCHASGVRTKNCLFFFFLLKNVERVEQFDEGLAIDWATDPPFDLPIEFKVQRTGISRAAVEAGCIP